MNLDKEDVEWLEKEYGEENFSIRNLALRLADIAASAVILKSLVGGWETSAII
jgi:hypothetical protein